MSLLYKKIQDLKLQARKDKSKDLLSIYTLLSGDIENAVSAGKKPVPLDDKLVISVLESFKKNINECLKALPQEDLRRAKLGVDLLVIESLIPPPVVKMTEDETREAVKKLFHKTRVCDFTVGYAMPLLKEMYGERLNGQMASVIVKNEFAPQ